MSLRRTWARVVGWRERERRATELDQEIVAHLQILEGEFRAAGMNEADARAAARRAFGNVTLARERSDEAWLFRWLESLVQDARYGARMLKRFPGASITIIGILAIGLGACTTLYSLIDACILHSIDTPVVDRWVAIRAELQDRAGYANFFSVPELDDVSQLTDMFENTGAVTGCDPVITGVDPPERVSGACATASALAMTQVRPLLGRLYTAEEDRPGGPPVVVIGYDFWQRHFRGDPGIIGRTIQLNWNGGRVQDYTIVGVMPRFYGMWSSTMWMPFQLDHARGARGDRRFWITAVTRPGISDAAARSRLRLLSKRWVDQYGATNPEYGRQALGTWNIQEAVVGGMRPAYMVLGVAVTLLLLLTCANAASLMLARAVSRTRELAIRASIGAGRWRLLRQMLVEGLLLSTIAATAGAALAVWLLPLVVRLIPGDWLTADPARIRVNGAALAFTAILALATGILSSVLPAWRGSRRDLAGGIRDRGTSEGSGTRDRRMQHAFIGAEIALALAIASAAGLAIMTYQRLTAIDPGFDAAEVVSTRGISLGGQQYPGDRDVARFYDLLFERLRAEPGVIGAAAVSGAPMTYRTVDVMSYDIVLDGRPPETGRPAPNARFRIVSDDYFRVVETPLRSGRTFGPQDDASAAPVAIVNESMAKTFWPDGAIGQRFYLRTRIGRRDADAINSPDARPMTVVGVVADAVQVDVLTAPIKPEFYLPLRQRLADARGLTLVVRGKGDPSLTAAALQRTLGRIDPDQAVIDLAVLSDRVRLALGPSRLTMLLLLIFAGIGLTLAAVGVYALVSYTVVQRTREIGLRMAVGAQPSDILRLMATQSIWLAVGGVLAGIALSLMSARVIDTVLYGVSATDWRVLTGVSGLLVMVVVCAAIVPARRATRIDPVSALSGN